MLKHDWKQSRLMFTQRSGWDSEDSWSVGAGLAFNTRFSTKTNASLSADVLYIDGTREATWGANTHIHHQLNPHWNIRAEALAEGNINGDHDLEFATANLKIERSLFEGRYSLFVQAGADFDQDNDFKTTPFIRSGISVRIGSLERS